MAEYHNQSKLRFWCQMVLPLVYDDSLSYMELLNKVVTYLNNCIQDVGNCETNIESLLEAFVNLQDYVNEIAEDISPLIEEKIDEMIESGEFGEILADALATVVAPEYDPNDSYIPLNYAIHDGTLYCCTSNTTGEWDSTKWRETTVGDELNTLMQKVYSLNAGDVSFDPTATYASGTVGNKLKNLTANDVEYNSSQTYNNATVGKELSNLNGALTNIITAKRISAIDDLNTSENHFVTFAENVSVGGITFPQYAKGMLVTNMGNDASLYAIGLDGKLYTAFRTNNEWRYGKAVTNEINDLNGAINNGTLLNGIPQTAMRIPTNSDLNSYTTAGTYYVQSDGDAATIANMPRAASGTLYVINRAIGSYKTQFYFPTTSIQIYYTRNYNNGTWTDWVVKSDSNSNIANVELTNTATQPYSKGDFVVVNGVLQKAIASISNGDSFSSGTNITPAVAMNVIKSMGAHKTFTAKLYDYDTFIRDIPNQWYWKIGELIIVFIETTWNHNDDIQTMVEIRDLPCNVVSGVCYIANLSGTCGADRTIQGSGQWAFIRPNLKSSEMNNTDGIFQMLIFGYERNGYPYPD